MKRVLDFTLALFGLVVFSPIFIFVSLWILISDGVPVLFRQVRVGRNGVLFTLLKFRSMRNENAGSLITVGGDSRITPVGRILRKTKLDELPQLINVLKGEMSFVGPRPEVERYTSLYRNEQREVLSLMPGITDPASLVYFNESEVLAGQKDPETHYVNVLMPEKIRINLAYGKRANVFSDVGIILRTVLRVAGVKSTVPKEFRANA